MKRNLVVENEPMQWESSPPASTLSEPLAALKAEWANALERERLARQAIVNLAAQIEELDSLISDARLRAAAPVPITAGLQGITDHAAKKRQAQGEAECLLEAKDELMKQLARMESEFRGFLLEKSGIREGIFRLFFNDLLQKHKPLFARLAALGLQLGLTENMVAFELFNGCNDDLTDLIHELGI